MAPASPDDEDAEFLTSEEKDFVRTLRQRFHEEFDSREANGRAYRCFFGAIALARILHAVDGNVEKACEWFQAAHCDMTQNQKASCCKGILRELKHASCWRPFSVLSQRQEWRI